jgi:peptidoglycan hydrolase CwlO-like protein
MRKGSWVKSIFMIPVIFMAFFIFSTSQVSGQNGSTPENKGKMNKIIDLQTETLQKLFAQEQKIGAIAKEETVIAREIETLNRRIAGLQKSISNDEIAYIQKKEDLKQLLQSYQWMGPGSYLGMILESNDLADFLRRLNILRDITRNTGKLIEQLQNSKEKQAADKIKLTGELSALKSKQARFNELLDKEKKLIKALEAQMASLAEERENYRKYLTDLKNTWDELKPLFSSAVKAFSGLMEKGDLPQGSFKLTVGFMSLKGSITDKALNEIIARDPSYPQTLFSFEQGHVEMSMPDKNLILNGRFMIQGENAIKYQVDKGSFYGIPLESGALKELFQDGDLVINCNPLLLDGYTIDSVETMDGYLQFLILPEI